MRVKPHLQLPAGEYPVGSLKIDYHRLPGDLIILKEKKCILSLFFPGGPFSACKVLTYFDPPDV